MNDKIVALGFGAAILLGTGALALWDSGFNLLSDGSHGAIGACEEHTRERLKSPASFKLVWSDYTAMGPLTDEDRKTAAAMACEPDCNNIGSQLTRAYSAYIDKNGPRLAAKKLKGQKLTAEENDNAELWLGVQKAKKENAEREKLNLPEDRTAHVTLEYDADNSYGASLREFAMCRFGAIGTDGSFAKSDIAFAGPIETAVGQETKELAERIAKQ